MFRVFPQDHLKNWPNGEFENRMSQIRSIFKQMFGNRSIFKQMFENTVHFQTKFEKNIPPQGAAAPWEGYFFQILFENVPYFQTSVWKWTYFQTSVWKLTIFGSSYFQTRHWASFSNFHHLVGDASYQRTRLRCCLLGGSMPHSRCCCVGGLNLSGSEVCCCCCCCICLCLTNCLQAMYTLVAK